MSLFGVGSSKNQNTFRYKKGDDSSGSKLQKHILVTLGTGNLKEAVRLPPGEDLNEWLAVNTVDFFNQVGVMYATLTEYCTTRNCAKMTAGKKYEYRWADGVTIKKPINVSAPKYVEFLMEWIEKQLEDDSIFPKQLGAPFPPNFQDVVKTIFKRLFRVYAHIYHSHFEVVVYLKEEAHLNTCFKHFVLFTCHPIFKKERNYIDEASSASQKYFGFNIVYFAYTNGAGVKCKCEEFNLINSAELAPLSDLVDSILQKFAV